MLLELRKEIAIWLVLSIVLILIYAYTIFLCFSYKGVPSVPYGHIYHPTAGLVEEVKVSKPYFKAFKESLESYVRGSCDLPSDTPDELGEFE